MQEKIWSENVWPDVVCFQYCLLRRKEQTTHWHRKLASTGRWIGCWSNKGIQKRCEVCWLCVTHCSSAHERSHMWAAKQKYVTLLLEASNDKAGVENLLSYAKYIKNNVDEVFIFSPSSLSSVLQMHIYKLFNMKWKTVHSRNDFLCQCIGIRTDGATSMTRVQNGFVHNLFGKY
jgi:hypothetical protein